MYIQPKYSYGDGTDYRYTLIDCRNQYSLHSQSTHRMNILNFYASDRKFVIVSNKMYFTHIHREFDSIERNKIRWFEKFIVRCDLNENEDER